MHSKSHPKQGLRKNRTLDRLLEPELFRALGDPTRQVLFACLVKCGRACSVSELAECCSVDLSVVSRHLSQLARAGALEVERQGRTVLYAVRTTELMQRFRALADALESCDPGCCGSDE